MAVSREGNVIVASADGDTCTGVLYIKSIKAVAGSGASTASVTQGSVKIYDEPALSANTSTTTDHVDAFVGYADTLTFNMSGTGTKIYIYIK